MLQYLLFMKCQMSADTKYYYYKVCQWLVPSCEISSRTPRFANREVANVSDF